jgi:hypothetical protein
MENKKKSTLEKKKKKKNLFLLRKKKFTVNKITISHDIYIFFYKSLKFERGRSKNK